MTGGVLATLTGGDMTATVAVPVGVLWVCLPIMAMALVALGMLIDDAQYLLCRMVRRMVRRIQAARGRR